MQELVMWSVPFFIVMGTCLMAFFYSIMIVSSWNDQKLCAWFAQTFALGVFVWTALVVIAGQVGLLQ